MSDAQGRSAVSLAMIVKDGGDYFRRCLASVVKPITIARYNGGPCFDEIVVLLDSRTSDATEDTLAEFAAKQTALGGTFVVAKHDWPNHFGEARNRSFALATGDWVGWIDSDDELVGAEFCKPHICESLKKGEVALHLPYWYIVAPDGRVKSKLWRERFVKRSYGWTWVGSVHEHLIPARGYQNPPRARFADEAIRVVHLPTEAEIASHLERNARLTDPSTAPDPVERGRMLYFRGRDLRDTDRKEAEACWRELLGINGAVDLTGTKLARVELVRLLVEDRRFDEAKAETTTYMEKFPDSRTGPLLMSNVYAIVGDPLQCVRWFERAMEIAPEVDPAGIDDTEIAALVCDQALRAGLTSEQKARILALVQENYPEDAGKIQRRLLRYAVRAQRASDMLVEYGKYLHENDEFLRAGRVLDSVPHMLRRDERLALERRRVRKYLDSHGTSPTNHAWAPIEQDHADKIRTDDRSTNIIYDRAVWIAERVWASGWRKILSLGCSDGLIEGYLAYRFPGIEIVALDPDAQCIEHARKMFQLDGLRFELNGFGHSRKDWDRFVELSEWCDGWFCAEVMEHVRFYSSLWNPLIRPGLLTTPAVQPDYGEPPWDQIEHYMGVAGHLRIFTLPEIQSEVRPSGAQRRSEYAHPYWAVEVPPQGFPRSDNQFVFVCVGSPFLWGPETARTRGLTGSEECVVYLSEALAAQGYRVTVACAQLEGQERIVNGVMWTGTDYLAEHDLQDPTGEDTVLVVWRQLGYNGPMFDTLKARKCVLWLHDAASCFAGIEEKAWERFDTIVCATDYHKRTIAEAYPVTKDRVVTIRHGIPEMPTGPKVPGRVIYASSPDRGLERLLEWWPDVKARVPNATLSVYYGRDNLRVFAMLNPHLSAMADRIEAKLKELAPLGVTDHGLVAHHELHKAFGEAQVHAYPTTFEEISCAHEDTLIEMPRDHAIYPKGIPIKKLVGREGFPVWAFDSTTNRFRLATCTRVWQTKVASVLIKATLDNGQNIRLTPEHPVLDFDGTWHRADSLRPGMRLMALHRRYGVWIKDFNGEWVSESRMTGQWKSGRVLSPKEHVDHLDPTRLDNSPEMLQVLSSSEHRRKTMTGIRISKLASVSRVARFKRLAATPDGQRSIRSKAHADGKRAWEVIRSWTADEQQAFFRKRSQTRMKRYSEDPEYRDRVNKGLKTAIANRREKRTQNSQNHRIENVERIEGSFPVYDMEVEGLHNFVAEGVVVHNCLTIQKAQAAKCVPVYAAAGCLGEVVPNYGPFWPELSTIEGDEARRRFVDSIESALKDGPTETTPPPTWERAATAWGSL